MALLVGGIKIGDKALMGCCFCAVFSYMVYCLFLQLHPIHNIIPYLFFHGRFVSILFRVLERSVLRRLRRKHSHNLQKIQTQILISTAEKQRLKEGEGTTNNTLQDTEQTSLSFVCPIMAPVFHWVLSRKAK